MFSGLSHDAVALKKLGRFRRFSSYYMIRQTITHFTATARSIVVEIVTMAVMIFSLEAA